MRSEDALTTLPWAVVLSAIALALAWRSYRRREFASMTAWVGWATLAWAVWLVGLMRMAVRVGAAVADWAGGFVFRPTVWLGVAIGALGILLVVAGRLVARRRGEGRRAAKKARQSAAVEPAGGRPATQRGQTSGSSADTGAAAAGEDDMDDIEAILRRHGIE